MWLTDPIWNGADLATWAVLIPTAAYLISRVANR